MVVSPMRSNEGWLVMVMVMVMVWGKCVGLVWFGLGKESESDG